MSTMPQPRARWDILSIGDATLDIFLAVDEAIAECHFDTRKCQLCFSYGDKVPVRSLTRVIGGNAANNAVGSRRLGLRSAIYGVTGDDTIGDLIKKQLRGEGVDVSYFKQDRDTEANTSVVLWYGTERTILIYHAPHRYPWPAAMPASRYVYLTSTRAGFEKHHPDILAYLKRTRSKLVFQPGTFQLKLGLKKLKLLLQRTELFVVNREEAAELLGKSASAPVPQLMHALAAYGPKLVSVTDGEAGAWGCDGQKCYEISLFPGERVEPTGAGDAYATAVTAALALGKPFAEALLWGPINAAGVIQKIGPQAGLLTRAQLERQLKAAPRYKLSIHPHR